jgi:hypothetical protein
MLARFRQIQQNYNFRFVFLQIGNEKNEQKYTNRRMFLTFKCYRYVYFLNWGNSDIWNSCY